MSRITRIALFAFALMLAGALGAVVSFYVSLRHMRVGFISEKDADTIRAAADLARAAISRNPSCNIKVDESSIGEKRQEAMMLYVAAMVDLYQVGFGSLPTRIADLDRLRDFDNSSKLNGRELENVCSIYSDGNGSFVVSCGQSRPSNPEVVEFMRKADNVKKFYRLGQLEILYVPIPRCS